MKKQIEIKSKYLKREIAKILFIMEIEGLSAKKKSKNYYNFLYY